MRGDKEGNYKALQAIPEHPGIVSVELHEYILISRAVLLDTGSILMILVHIT